MVLAISSVLFQLARAAQPVMQFDFKSSPLEEQFLTRPRLAIDSVGALFRYCDNECRKKTTSRKSSTEWRIKGFAHCHTHHTHNYFCRAQKSHCIFTIPRSVGSTASGGVMTVHTGDGTWVVSGPIVQYGYLKGVPHTIFDVGKRLRMRNGST